MILAIIATLFYASFGVLVALRTIKIEYFVGSWFDLWIRALIFVIAWPAIAILNELYKG